MYYLKTEKLSIEVDKFKENTTKNSHIKNGRLRV